MKSSHQSLITVFILNSWSNFCNYCSSISHTWTIHPLLFYSIRFFKHYKMVESFFRQWFCQCIFVDMLAVCSSKYFQWVYVHVTEWSYWLSLAFEFATYQILFIGLMWNYKLNDNFEQGTYWWKMLDLFM